MKATPQDFAHGAELLEENRQLRARVAELEAEQLAVRRALVDGFVSRDDQPGPEVPLIRIVEHAVSHHDWHHEAERGDVAKAARELAELRDDLQLAGGDSLDASIELLEGEVNGLLRDRSEEPAEYQRAIDGHRAAIRLLRAAKTGEVGG